MPSTLLTPSSSQPVPPDDDSPSLLPKKLSRSRPLFDPEIVRRASAASFAKLNPATLLKNPVMFVVEAGAALTTIFLVRDLIGGGAHIGFQLQITLWLWFTVLFANFAEAMAEARGKAQADSLRRTKTDVVAKRVASSGQIEPTPGSALRAGDVVICDAGDLIPGDGEVIEGIATVDESVITGESAPVIRESGGDRSAVTGGTRILSDQIRIRITSNPGETFLDRMIALVEGAQRQKTPNEIALNILIADLDADLHAGRDYATALLLVQRGPGRLRFRTVGRGARVAPGLPDPNDHRRSPFRDRHRRHGPRHAAQRARHER